MKIYVITLHTYFENGKLGGVYPTFEEAIEDIKRQVKLDPVDEYDITEFDTDIFYQDGGFEVVKTWEFTFEAAKKL